MIFSFDNLLVSVLFALLAALMAGGIAYLGGTYTLKLKRDDDNPRTGTPGSAAISAAIITLVISFFLHRLVLYYFMPALTGSFFGFWTPLFFSALVALPIGFLLGGRSGKKVLASALFVLAMIVVPTVQWTFNAVGPGNAARFAALANVEIAKDDERLPPTDERHLVTVSPEMAFFKARAALTESRANYSTRWKIGPMTLQSLRTPEYQGQPHRFYAASLVPTNSADTFWTPLFGSRTVAPGYVLVDAEDKSRPALLRDGHAISLFEEGNWSMNLQRFAYTSGYRNGSLEHATFEVDDDGNPHYTLTFERPAFGNITGRRIEKVLVISFDKSTGEPKLVEHQPGAKEIEWVDTVTAVDQVSTWASDWGMYGQSYAKSGIWAWFMVWTGMSTQDVMIPAELDDASGHHKAIMRSYTRDAHNVYVVPMTSSNRGNNSVMGVLVFDSQTQKGKYYPGIHGFNHGVSAGQTMFRAPGNAQAKFTIEHIELLHIFGHETWVAIYASQQMGGSTFGAIGFLNARSQEAGDVAFSTDPQTALLDYQRRLAHGAGSNLLNREAATKRFEGVVWRVGSIGNGTSWRFRLNGVELYFDADTSVFPGLPLLRDGDRVRGAYMDTQNPVAAVTELELLPAVKAPEPKAPDAN